MMPGMPRRPPSLPLLLAIALLALAVAAGALLVFGRESGTTRVLAGFGFALAVLALGLALALYLRRRLRHPIARLISSAERISAGDYSGAVAVRARDELGELATALDRMRKKLKQTTISRDYLDRVLNSMNDAVLVTTDAGRIRHVNEAAARLLGWSDQELQGRELASLLSDSERPAFVLERAATETRETVFATKSGARVPVSLSGSALEEANPDFRGLIFVARNITEKRKAEQRIRYLARYDALTRLPNRMQFQHLLQQAIARARRNHTELAFLYLDLDHFKDINDTLGHAAGDRALEVLSERLTRIAPSGAVAGRLAGDEFGLFLEDLPEGGDHRATVGAMARRVLDDMGRAFHLTETEVFLTVSIGIAFCPDDAGNTIDLIRAADAAMYHAKQSGGNTYACYNADMNAASVERLMLKGKLRRAIERDEFLVLYQPKIDLRTMRVAGAEALLRWRLPGHGDIAPAQFIPLAEESDLISPIGEWVLRRVCADYASWAKTVPDPGRVSINLSLKQLRHASFLPRCRSVFAEMGVAPSNFELEITETTFMKDAPNALPLLRELEAMDIHLSIDDFGTGYSSLAALQQLPVETLKMDQSFVRGLPDSKADCTLAKTIIDMGRSLGLDVVAEGVESTAQLSFLREHGCHYAQGRLFGEPIAAGAFLACLDAQRRGIAPFARHFALPAAARPPGA
jgi:diguanylate cyclase (GGDEF)-like protein/PAS domain S-box-containing protein